ncbi:unnamed protein product [marine sediment metagenome]|uniref:Uncharacterized protein n=1 Tax=marine sediment metagenome TaxID=412755 RepID=X1HLI0_9ZZZZ
MTRKGIVRKGVLSVHKDQRFGEFCVSWRYLPSAGVYVITLQKGKSIIKHAHQTTKAKALKRITQYKRSVKGWKRSIY